MKSIDKIKNTIGKNLFDHIVGLNKPELESQLAALNKELARLADALLELEPSSDCQYKDRLLAEKALLEYRLNS